MISEDKIKLIQKLYIEGETKGNIAKIVGVSAPTVTRHLKGVEKIDEMIGKKFGQLLVVKQAPKDPSLVSRCIRYECRCDCGEVLAVNGNSLRSGHTTSCGCSRKGVNIIDLTSQTFGLLKVIELVETNDERRAVWKCRCECGRETTATSHSLISGKQKSCGCLKESLGERKIAEILTNNNIQYAPQYRIKECKNIQTLPFDFAIFIDGKLIGLIEYQGDIHYMSTGGWNTKQDLIQRQERDKLKRKFCETNQIPLLEIPYWDYEKIDIEYIKKGLNCGL